LTAAARKIPSKGIIIAEHNPVAIYSLQVNSVIVIDFAFYTIQVYSLNPLIFPSLVLESSITSTGILKLTLLMF
jgi:hypothetical protein